MIIVRNGDIVLNILEDCDDNYYLLEKWYFTELWVKSRINYGYLIKLKFLEVEAWNTEIFNTLKRWKQCLFLCSSTFALLASESHKSQTLMWTKTIETGRVA